jgi:hypothetical protein
MTKAKTSEHGYGLHLGARYIGKYPCIALYLKKQSSAPGLAHKVGPIFSERVFGAKPVSKLTVQYHVED